MKLQEELQGDGRVHDTGGHRDDHRGGATYTLQSGYGITAVTKDLLIFYLISKQPSVRQRRTSSD